MMSGLAVGKVRDCLEMRLRGTHRGLETAGIAGEAYVR
jgi:hypothetical protein